jgi:hypothetical protein
VSLAGGRRLKIKSPNPSLNLVRWRIRLGKTLLLESFQQISGGGVAEVAGAVIPGRGLSRVADGPANTGAAEKAGVESRTQPQRRRPVTRIGGTFIEQAGRRDVARAEKPVAAGHKRRNFRRGQALVGRGLCRRRRSGPGCCLRRRVFLFRSR